MNSDLIDLLRCLNTDRVRYLVVGGYAVMKYTEPRYTKDLDIWIEASDANAKRVYKALTCFGAPLENVEPRDFAKAGVLFMMGLAPNRFDLLTRIKGVNFQTAWKHREKGTLRSIKVNFLSLNDLIKSKRAAGRPQDLIDAKNLTNMRTLQRGSVTRKRQMTTASDKTTSSESSQRRKKKR